MTSVTLIVIYRVLVASIAIRSRLLWMPEPKMNAKPATHPKGEE
jgi:hypothetical protein